MAEQSTKAAYQARLKRFNDAVSLRRPDRVPVTSLADLWMARYAGLTDEEAMHDYDKVVEAWKKSMLKLNWDLAPAAFNIWAGGVWAIGGFTQFKWAGHGTSAVNGAWQFIEGEYMLASEYDEFLRNPGDFTVRKLLPRISTMLAPLAMLPPLHIFASDLTLGTAGGTMASLPEMAKALQQLVKFGEETGRYNAAHATIVKDLEELGYPPLMAVICLAPFDFISDMLRGMRGSMLDMYRCPDKLLAAVDLYTDVLIETTLANAKRSGNPRIFMPLHRGAGAFMSKEQFARFYWPSLKKMFLTYIDAGLTPMPFLEGDYTPRLEFLAELPPGKVLGHFDQVDMKKYKEILGDKMAFWGNVPAAMLCTGKPEQVKAYVRMLIDTVGDRGGLVIDGAVGGIPPEARPENVEAMTEAVFEYGVYR